MHTYKHAHIHREKKLRKEELEGRDSNLKKAFEANFLSLFHVIHRCFKKK